MSKKNTKEPETAEGFLTGLIRSGLNAEQWGAEDIRPVCSSEPPLGRAKGDGGFLIHEPHRTSPVILELEASNPGNERNILKWAAPASKSTTLQIRPGIHGEPREFANIDVVLCFGRAPQGSKKSDWTDSDFDKTVAHCEFLAETINDHLRNNNVRFTVLAADARVERWSEFGMIAAMKYVTQRRSASWAGASSDRT